MSSFTTNISILNALSAGIAITNSVTPSLDSKLWGILSNSAPNGGNATEVLGFNRDDGITIGDTWTFTTEFTLDGVNILLQEQMTGIFGGSKVWQSMTAGSASTGFQDTTENVSIGFTGISGAEYALSWGLSPSRFPYYSIQYTISLVKPAYQPITPVMPQIKTIVMLMLENRSLDNVLGWLYNGSAPAVVYPPGSSPTFDGIPSNASNSYKTTAYVPQQGTQGYNNPWRVPAYDPNEPMPSVLDQLYCDADGNKPSNPWSQTPAMQGFAYSYYYDYIASIGEVMGAYSAEQLPVLYGLAQNFAVSDRWFASVPTQTNPNRAFSICGTSLGAEVNSDINGSTYQYANTIFNVLGTAGKTWGLYWVGPDPSDGVSAKYYFTTPATSYLFPVLNQSSEGAIYKYSDFWQAASSGTLPNFCYLEPFWGGGKGSVLSQNDWFGVQGNDYHPCAWIGPAEYDLNNLYQALVNSPQWPEMLFIITFDEHGGNWDHVPPGNAVPPDASVGPSGFTFNRLGVRVPTILISPFIQSGTVFRAPTGSSQDFDHTSFLATLCKWAGVDPASSHLGARTSVAPTFENVIGTSARADKPSFTVPADYATQGGGVGALVGLQATKSNSLGIDVNDFRDALDEETPEAFVQKLTDLVQDKK